MFIPEDLEEIILALRAAGFNPPNFEILPDGAVYFSYGSKDINSFLHITPSGGVDSRYQSRD